MFTGIITHIGEIVAIDFNDNKDCLLTIFVAKNIDRKLEVGCSIACNGACLTLIKKDSQKLYFQASKETCKITTIKNWQKGQKINLEFALRLGDELGGHLVLGHVDGIAKINEITKIQDSHKFGLKLEENSQDLAQFIAKKGSICLNGVSLTINSIENDIFYVNIIAHSFKNTTFDTNKIGDLVNVEIDTIARYVLNAKNYDKK